MVGLGSTLRSLMREARLGLGSVSRRACSRIACYRTGPQDGCEKRRRQDVAALDEPSRRLHLTTHPSSVPASPLQPLESPPPRHSRVFQEVPSVRGGSRVGSREPLWPIWVGLASARSSGPSCLRAGSRTAQRVVGRPLAAALAGRPLPIKAGSD